MMDRIGRYQIIGELGRGAMGVVFHAIDPSIGRPVAIKTIRILDINDTQQRNKLRERLFREARSAGVLSHPNIVTIYDMDEFDGLAYIAMAYVNGPTLERILASESAISGAKMLRILRQAAAALDYAHGRGIVHRDVKPGNIMTDEDGSVKITDFGIAKIAEGAHATDTRTVAGTPNYMSPEQVQGMPVDGRSDQFSLAVIAYEILTGERPFVGEHLSTIVFKIVAEEPAAAQQLNGTLTDQIDQVLRKGLAKKPEDRYPTCSNFVGALELACAESRGWKTVPAGTASSLPTLAVDQMPGMGPAPRYFEPEPLRDFDEPPKRAWLMPLFLSILVVAGVAAVFVYQSGLAGQPSKPEAPRKAAIAENQPPPDVQPPPEVKAPEETPPTAQASPPVDAPPQPVPPPPAKEEAPPPQITPDPRISASRTPSSRLQDIWVTSNPPGAKAVIDGNFSQACYTPCMLHGASGAHQLAISQAGYINEYREVRVGETAIDVPQVTLTKPEGTLFLTTNPPGASIRVNGQLLSQLTPAKITRPPGTYSITVEKDGVSRTQDVQVRDGLGSVSITLNQ